MNIYNLLKNILFNECIENESVIIYLNNEFHILEHFSHIIKKKNIKIYIITYDNYIIYNNLINGIKNEECENFVNIYLNINELSSSNNCETENLKKIFIFDLFNSETFSKILDDIRKSSIYKRVDLNTNLNFYLYSYLSNENIYKRMFKNKILDNIKNISTSITSTVINLDNILSMSDILHIIEDYNMSINSINILKNVNYLFIGDYIFYKIKFSYK
jgi:hypothetical protein